MQLFIAQQTAGSQLQVQDQQSQAVKMAHTDVLWTLVE